MQEERVLPSFSFFGGEEMVMCTTRCVGTSLSVSMTNQLQK